jgi:non-ribosomal peptide synthetase component F
MFLLAVIGFGAAFEGYSQLLHPPALLGARGIEHAVAFDLLGFVVPGILAGLVAVGLRGQLDRSRWMARIGPWLWLLSAIAFAAQGLLPLDPLDLDAPSSRLHATAWMLWWIAFVPGAVLIAAGLGGEAKWRLLRRVAAAAAVLLPMFALVAAPLGMPVGIAQRLALAVWFGSLIVAGAAVQRGRQP